MREEEEYEIKKINMLVKHKEKNEWEGIYMGIPIMDKTMINMFLKLDIYHLNTIYMCTVC